MYGFAHGLGIFIVIFSSTANCVHFNQTSFLTAALDGEAKIDCTHNDSSLVVMLWYRQQRASMSLDLIGYSYAGTSPNNEDGFKKRFKQSRQGTVTGSLTISELNLTDSAVYYCAASNNANPAYFGNGTKLTVLDSKYEITKPNVTVIGPPVNERCKKRVTLLCVAQAFYPDHVKIKWKMGSKEVTKGVATDPYATKNENGMFDMSSRLKVKTKEWNRYTFTCIVTFFNGAKEDVQEETIAGQGGFDREAHFKNAQTVKLAYGVFIAKSGLYGFILFVFVWRQGSAGK